MNTYQNDLDPVKNLENAKAKRFNQQEYERRFLVKSSNHRGRTKNQKNDKTATIQAETSMELAVSQEWKNDKHMEITLLMIKIHTRSLFACTWQKNFMMGEEKNPTSFTDAYKMMLH